MLGQRCRWLLPWLTLAYLALFGGYLRHLTMRLYPIQIMRTPIPLRVTMNTTAIPKYGPCTQGPYLYETLEGSIHEGLGMLRPKIVQSMLLARFLNLSHVFNSDWFDNEHHTDYSLLYDFDEDNDCGEDRLDQITCPHLKIIDIDPYPDEHAPDLFELCREFISTGALSRSTLDRSSFLGQFLDSSHLRSPSTVYRLQRDYFRDYLDTSRLVLYPDCLQLLPTAFRRRKQQDLITGKSARFVPQIDVLSIAFYLRWGDRGHHRNLSETNVSQGISILHQLLHHRYSVLHNIQNYRIYFISEAAHSKGDFPPSRTNEFDFVLASFPPGRVELRVHPARFVEDFDVLTSAHVYLTTLWSSFVACHMEQVNVSSTAVIVPWSRQLNWYGLLDDKTDGALQAWERFNRLYCCINVLPSLRRRCAVILKSAVPQSLRQGRQSTCEEIQHQSLSRFGSTALHNAYHYF